MCIVINIKNHASYVTYKYLKLCYKIGDRFYYSPVLLYIMYRIWFILNTINKTNTK